MERHWWTRYWQTKQFIKIYKFFIRILFRRFPFCLTFQKVISFRFQNLCAFITASYHSHSVLYSPKVIVAYNLKGGWGRIWIIVMQRRRLICTVVILDAVMVILLFVYVWNWKHPWKINSIFQFYGCPWKKLAESRILLMEHK